MAPRSLHYAPFLVLFALLAGGCVRSGWDVGGELGVSPSSMSHYWIARGEKVTLYARVTRGGNATPRYTLAVEQPWLAAQPVADDPARFAVKISTAELAAGTYAALVMVSDGAESVPLPVSIEVIELDVLHVGEVTGSCAREGATACDYWGAAALEEAVAEAQTRGGARILLYGGASGPAHYRGCVEVWGRTWIEAAPGVDRAQVVIFCGDAPIMDGGALTLRGDGVRVRDVTIQVRDGGYSAISAQIVDGGVEQVSSHHLIENVEAWASAPEFVGYNGIQPALSIGGDTVVRNCHLWGHFERAVDITGSRSRFSHNTTVFFQQRGAAIQLERAREVLIADNVFARTTPGDGALIRADVSTLGVRVERNMIEGPSRLIDAEAATRIVARDNVLAELPLEAPSRPFFLADAPPLSGSAAESGTSLDDVELAARAEVWPGAFQQRSVATERSMRVTVGEGSCGGEGCDLNAGQVDHALQRAVWGVWPGGEVQVYPTVTPISGFANISWALTLRGMGSSADEVVLTSSIESIRWRQAGLWYQNTMLSVAYGIEGVLVENLTLLIAGADAGPETIALQAGDAQAPLGQGVTDGIAVTLRGLRLINALPSGVSGPALFVGSHVLVRDSLVMGRFRSCLRAGLIVKDNTPTPPATFTALNLSCRLSGGHVAAFELAGVKDATLANIALELEPAAPLITAQERGPENATRDAPESFLLRAVSAIGVSQDFEFFSASDGDYQLSEIDGVAAGQLFRSSGDSHLLDGSSAMDTGVAPSSLGASFDEGTSLDGISRAGRKADRGCYEQGE